MFAPLAETYVLRHDTIDRSAYHAGGLLLTVRRCAPSSTALVVMASKRLL